MERWDAAGRRRAALPLRPESGTLTTRRRHRHRNAPGDQAMATEKTDVVIVGVGAAGAILAAELGKSGIKVIGLERGPRLKTADFEPHDELRYFQRQDLRPNVKRSPVTWRTSRHGRASVLPTLSYRNQAGGGTVHYGPLSGAFRQGRFPPRPA